VKTGQLEFNDPPFYTCNLGPEYPVNVKSHSSRVRRKGRTLRNGNDIVSIIYSQVMTVSNTKDVCKKKLEFTCFNSP
jgi:hypothetical protein